jgi:N-methylhydantoinase A
MEGDREGKIITCDMGGTSFDVSAVTDGKIKLSRETRIGDDVVAIMKVDTRSIGAGGGSIAWVDPGKLVHVGPNSAGAIPGPACYLRGGEDPTVTDANVVLGYLDPDYFLGGNMKIDPQLSEKVINEKIAAPLGLNTLEAAYTIWSTINHNMVATIEDITIWQGVDPREYLLVAGGGACGLHIGPIAEELKMKKMIVPKLSGVLSAVGGLAADMNMDFHFSLFTDTGQFDYKGINKKLKDLEKQAKEFLSRTGIASKDTKIEFFVEARYANQVWELEIPLKGNQIKDEAALAEIIEEFHGTHERTLGVRIPGETIEFVSWRVQAIAKVPDMVIKEQQSGEADPAYALVAKRNAYFRELGGMVETPVYRGDKLLCGARINGPAIIQEPTSTLVIFPDSKATVSKWGNYLVELD